jgi:hypothetical protein
MGNLIISTAYQMLLVLAHDEDSEMGGTCGTYIGVDTYILGSGGMA